MYSSLFYLYKIKLIPKNGIRKIHINLILRLFSE